MFTGRSDATDVLGLYDIEIPSQGSSEAARSADFRLALEGILKRVVKGDAVAEPALQKILAKPDDFVSEFAYTDQTRGNGQNQPLLRVKFSKNKLNQALRANHVAIWHASRPETLVWLVVQTPAETQLLHNDNFPEIRQTLLGSASRRGIPILLPLMDLSDQQAITTADVASGNDERVYQASTRYGAKVVATGQLTQLPDGQWQTGWRILRNTAPPVVWQSNPTPDLRAVFDAGINEVHKLLAASYAASGNQQSVLTLKVYGVRELREFVELQRYLKSTGQIKRAQWLALEPSGTVFKVQIEGDRNALEQTFALGSLIRPVANPVNPDLLEYELLQ